MTEEIRVGTAGWALPAPVRDAFPAAASNLARYAGRFGAVEINSCFHRPHRRATYERWAASVPEDFRFAVKLPKTITHGLRLRACEAEIARFAEEVGGLGKKRGPVLVQLPPSLAFDAALAGAFFTGLAATLAGPIVCEPRHPSWFDPEADALLAAHRIARVAADPAPVPAAAMPGGWRRPGLFPPARRAAHLPVGLRTCRPRLMGGPDPPPRRQCSRVGDLRQHRSRARDAGRAGLCGGG